MNELLNIIYSELINLGYSPEYARQITSSASKGNAIKMVRDLNDPSVSRGYALTLPDGKVLRIEQNGQDLSSEIVNDIDSEQYILSNLPPQMTDEYSYPTYQESKNKKLVSIEDVMTSHKNPYYRSSKPNYGLNVKVKSPIEARDKMLESLNKSTKDFLYQLPVDVRYRLVDYAYNNNRSVEDALLYAYGIKTLNDIQKNPTDFNAFNKYKDQILDRLKNDPNAFHNLNRAVNEIEKATMESRGKSADYQKYFKPDRWYETSLGNRTGQPMAPIIPLVPPTEDPIPRNVLFPKNQTPTPQPNTNTNTTNNNSNTTTNPKTNPQVNPNTSDNKTNENTQTNQNTQNPKVIQKDQVITNTPQQSSTTSENVPYATPKDYRDASYISPNYYQNPESRPRESVSNSTISGNYFYYEKPKPYRYGILPPKTQVQYIEGQPQQVYVINEPSNKNIKVINSKDVVQNSDSDPSVLNTIGRRIKEGVRGLNKFGNRLFMTDEEFKQAYNEDRFTKRVNPLMGKTLDEIREAAKTNKYSRRDVIEAARATLDYDKKAEELRQGTRKDKLEKWLGKAKVRGAKNLTDAQEDYIEQDMRGRYYSEDYANQEQATLLDSYMEQEKDLHVLPVQYSAKAARREAARRHALANKAEDLNIGEKVEFYQNKKERANNANAEYNERINEVLNVDPYYTQQKREKYWGLVDPNAEKTRTDREIKAEETANMIRESDVLNIVDDAEEALKFKPPFNHVSQHPEAEYMAAKKAAKTLIKGLNELNRPKKQEGGEIIDSTDVLAYEDELGIYQTGGKIPSQKEIDDYYFRKKLVASDDQVFAQDNSIIPKDKEVTVIKDPQVGIKFMPEPEYTVDNTYGPNKNIPTVISTYAKTRAKESNFDPYHLNIYGNKLQHYANMLPATYNASKYLFDKPEKEFSIYNKQDEATLSGLRNLRIAPNMNVLNSKEAIMKNMILQNSRNTGQLLSNLQQLNSNLATTAAQQATDIDKANTDLRVKYLDTLNRVGDARRVIDTETVRRNQGHRLTFEQHGAETIKGLEKVLLNKGQLHNKELEDYIKEQIYLNNLTDSYKIMTAPDGTKYVQFTGKHGPTVLSEEDFKKMFNTRAGIQEKSKSRKLGGAFKPIPIKRNSLYS
jgi:hypothetical protein